MLGIICAMDTEAELLLAASTVVSQEKALGTVFRRVKIGDTEAVLVVCGIGKALAAAATQHLLDLYKITAVINTGVAGALCSGIAVGEIVIADALVQHDMDTTPIGDPLGLISGWNMVDIPTDKALTSVLSRAAETAAIPFRVGKIATGDQFVASAERKAAIAESFSAIACEMEGAAVALVCHINSVPCAVVRCISDGDGEAMDYKKFKHFAADRSARVVLNFLEDYKAS